MSQPPGEEMRHSLVAYTVDWGKCSEGLVGCLSSPGDAEGEEHQGEEAKEDQANDERQQEGQVTGARETWQNNGIPENCCSAGRAKGGRGRKAEEERG